MPAWVDTPEEKAAWKKAKGIVREQRNKSEDDFTDRDWGLVTHIAQNILKSKVLSGSNSGLIFKLAKVERDLLLRAKKKDRDEQLPEESQAVLSALKKVMSVGGQSIAKLRKLSDDRELEVDAQALASELEAVADKLKELLDGLE